MRLVIIFLLSITTIIAKAQQVLHIKISAAENGAPVLANVQLAGVQRSFPTDTTGSATISFPANGNYTLRITAVDFLAKDVQIIIPHTTDPLLIELERQEPMEEVIIHSTRTSRTIANTPTRIETIELEEIDEKNNMRPANVAMLLHESTGIQVQQTSATSGNASIRMQGLDGRYTQLLKNGFANFGNFSSGLSVLEIPPLDLKQVEIMKGPASPLYGGGAIAGVVNFISKTPGAEPEYSFILNHSNIGQSNSGAFLSARGKKAGFTLLALYNHSKPFDVDKDDFTEIPLSNEFTVNPKVFLYAGKTTIAVGNSFNWGKRMGGDLQVIQQKGDAYHRYFEENKTIRNTSTVEVSGKVGERKKWLARQSFGVFDRTINIPSYFFSGINYNGNTDLSYITNGNKHSFVLGANYSFEKFNEKTAANRDNHLNTGGIYGQHTWDASPKIKLETGLRMDIVHYRNDLYSRTETFLLPRISLLVKYNQEWSSRIGGGMGYKTPTLFTEETETMQYRNIDPLLDVRSEKSYGGTADVNFKTSLGAHFSFSLNHMFFYTWIDRPLFLEYYAINHYRFVNAEMPIRSAGFETNAKFIYRDHLKLFLGYTYVDVKATYKTGNRYLPLVPSRKLNTALIYEKEGLVKIGLEGYFTSQQYLDNGTRTPSFSEFGLMAEKVFKRFSLYINLENFTDTRQSRYKNVVNGTHSNPFFDPIWTHTEGFVVNGGIKLKL